MWDDKKTLYFDSGGCIETLHNTQIGVDTPDVDGPTCCIEGETSECKDGILDDIGAADHNNRHKKWDGLD